LDSEGVEALPLEADLESRLNFINAALRMGFLNLVVCAALKPCKDEDQKMHPDHIRVWLLEEILCRQVIKLTSARV
jgi:hypothetical protein